jgi:catalase
VAAELAQKVAKNIGVEITATPKVKPHKRTSPALSMDKLAPNIKGSKVAILAGDGADARQITELKKQLLARGAMAEVIAKMPGTIAGSDGKPIAVDRVAANAPSVVYDAVFIPGGSAPAVAQLGLALHFVTEAFVHGKAIAAGGDGVEMLNKAQVASTAPGVVTDKNPATLVKGFIAAMLKRHYDRDVESLPV